MDRQIILVAHNIRSMWNVGAFFRTCDGLAIEKLYLTGYTAFPPRKEITKTAIGAEQHVAWEYVKDPLPLLDQLSQDGWQIVSLELDDRSVDLSSFEPSKKVCLVVGHELTGVPEELLQKSDAIVSIPMRGQKESLNVAVATGMALYALREAH